MQKKTVVVNFSSSPLKYEYFGEWARWWLDDYGRYLERSTLDGYKYTCEKLCETFENWKLRDMSAFYIETYLRAVIDSGLSHSYMRKLRAMLSQIFRKAEMFGLIEKNPMPMVDNIYAGIENPYQIEDGSFRDSFTIDEIRSLFCKLPTDKIGCGIRLMLSCGLRAQELLALEPCHIIEGVSIVCVRQAVKLSRGNPYIGSPKTLSSYRDVPIADACKPYVSILLNTRGRFLVPGKISDQPYDPSSFRRAYYRALECCDVRPLSPHCCRHTFISQLQSSCGVDLETIKSLAGHSKQHMTQGYLHVQRESQCDAVNRLNTLLE